MVLYDDLVTTTTVEIHSDDSESINIENVNQVVLDNGIIVVVDAESIMTFDGFRYSVRLKHNADATKEEFEVTPVPQSESIH